MSELHARHDRAGAEQAIPRPTRLPLGLDSPRRRRWLTALLVLIAAVYAVAVLADEPLRRVMERHLNAALKGYQVRIGGFDLHPLTLAWDLEDVVLVQSAHPDPPVARLPEIQASVQWSALLFGGVVADVALVRPVLHLSLAHLRAEAADKVPVEERGWQEAVQALHPFEINAFRVVEGDVTYLEPGFDPMHLTHLNVITRNIRNVRSAPGTLPSPLHVDAWVLDSATFRADGHADFLASPGPAVRLAFALDDLRLAWAQPAARHAGLTIRGGRLSADGRLAREPDGRMRVELDDGVARDLRVDYRLSGPGAETAEKAAVATARAATRSDPAATTTVRAERFRVRGGEIGMRDDASEPPWRVFLSDLDVRVEHLDTRPGAPPGRAIVRSRMQDSGRTEIDAHFGPPGRAASFDADVRVEHVDLRRLNDLLRATGGFDVTQGELSLYSEVAVHDGRVRGYVKPLFHDLEVYSRAQDAPKSFFRELYEGAVDGVAELLENQPRSQVATVTSIDGPLENPQASTLEIIVQLVRNAFIRAILPGLRGRD